MQKKNKKAIVIPTNEYIQAEELSKAATLAVNPGERGSEISPHITEVGEARFKGEKGLLAKHPGEKKKE